MKKYLATGFLVIILSFFTVGKTGAVTPTPKPTDKPGVTVAPTARPDISQEAEVNKIKDLVASRVAELKLVDKRGIIGNVKSASNTEMTVTDYKGQEIQIDIDELTKFESDSTNATFGISDIKTGDTLSIIGLYNKESKRLLARFVSEAKNIPLNLEGGILSKDAANFTITIITSDGKKKAINIESSTKTSSYDKDGLTKSGFTKIDTGEFVIVVGFADPKIKDQINASRVIHFPTLSLSSIIKKFIDIENENIPVSTGSAGKIQPIVK